MNRFLQVALNTDILQFVATNFKENYLKNVNGILICDKSLPKLDFQACNDKLIKLDTTVCTTSLKCDEILDQYIENVIWSPAATGNTDPQTNCQSSGTPVNCAQDLSGSTVLKFSDLMTSETTNMTLDYSL